MADNLDLTWILSSKGKKYTQCRVQLEEELQLPDSRDLSCQIAWNSYEKAYKNLCAEVMRTGELDMLKNRRCGSGVVDVMRRHILLRSKYLAKTGDKECKLMTEENIKFVRPKCHKEFEKEDPQTKLGTFLTFVTTELKKWASPMEKRKLIEELIDLVSVDGILEKIEKDMKQLIHADPETSLEILEKKAELVKILHNKWNICNEEVLDQLKRRDHYLAFKDSWRHLKAALPLHWERELLLLKQLFAAKPGLDVVKSVEHFWRVLDVTCCQAIIKPIQGAQLIQAASLEDKGFSWKRPSEMSEDDADLFKKAEDDRDIEQLLEFIEGEDGKEKKKDQSEKKKRREKRRNIPQNKAHLVKSLKLTSNKILQQKRRLWTQKVERAAWIQPSWMIKGLKLATPPFLTPQTQACAAQTLRAKISRRSISGRAGSQRTCSASPSLKTTPVTSLKIWIPFHRILWR